MNALLPWQADAWAALAQRRRAGRLPHALLLHGPAGTGKAQFAERLVQALLCEAPDARGEPCEACRGCRQHRAGSHPDCVVLRPDPTLRSALAQYPGQSCQADRSPAGAVIAVDQARELIARLQRSTHYGGARLGVLLPAEALNESAANALLKLVEEPPGGTVLILVSHRPGLLQATLRSRCQAVRLPRPAPAAAAAWLAQHVPEPARHALALELAAGAPLLARELAQQDLEAPWRAVADGIETVLAGGGDPVAVAAAWQDHAPELIERVLYAWLARALREGAAGALESAPVPGKAAPTAEAMVELLSELESLRRLERTPLSRPLAWEGMLAQLARAVA